MTYLTDPDSNQPKDDAIQHVTDPGHALGEVTGIAASLQKVNLDIHVLERKAGKARREAYMTLGIFSISALTFTDE